MFPRITLSAFSLYSKPTPFSLFSIKQLFAHVHIFERQCRPSLGIIYFKRPHHQLLPTGLGFQASDNHPREGTGCMLTPNITTIHVGPLLLLLLSCSSNMPLNQNYLVFLSGGSSIGRMTLWQGPLTSRSAVHPIIRACTGLQLKLGQILNLPWNHSASVYFCAHFKLKVGRQVSQCKFHSTIHSDQPWRPLTQVWRSSCFWGWELIHD